MDTWFIKYEDYMVCTLCPHMCRIGEGERGICGVRKNTGDKIELLTYGVISGYSLDPIGKKPLYHFFPGMNILSAGSYGCNMRCDFCQNWQISQQSAGSYQARTSPQKLVQDALNAKNNIGIAFTYNEPVIWFEFIRDVAVKAKEEGLFTVAVSNGYVNSRPLGEMTGFIDAFNIDLKAFSDTLYRKLTGAGIEPVKKALKQISASGKHLEITTLIIPGQNDNIKDIESQSGWIADELGDETPLHLSRYFPMYKRNDPETPADTMETLFRAASENLKYVYLGNTRSHLGNDTMCSNCGTAVTIRTGYNTSVMNIDKEGRCTRCGNLIYRYFTISSQRGS